ncbi:MAG: hypothetical protein JXA67_07395 [Micromonosporaceae bacterium]|nr:hypothetical protein [Micromonosporaceae bacterium]
MANETTDPVNVSSLNWEKALTRILGIENVTKRDVVCDSKWLEFDSITDVCNVKSVPDAKDGKYYFCLYGGESPEATAVAVVMLSEYYQVTINKKYLDGAKKDYDSFLAPLASPDILRHPPKMDSDYANRAFYRFSALGELSQGLVDEISQLIAGIDTSASGFSGSSAEAFVNDLKAIQLAFKGIAYNTVGMECADTSGQPGGDLAVWLATLGDAQTVFCDTMHSAWIKWRRHVWRKPQTIMNEILKSVDSQLRAKLKAEDTDWHVSITLPHLSSKIAAKTITVNIATGSGWGKIDQYAKQVWTTAIEDILDNAARVATEALQNTFTAVHDAVTDTKTGVRTSRGPYRPKSTTGGSEDKDDNESSETELTKALDKLLNSNKDRTAGDDDDLPDYPTVPDDYGDDDLPGGPTVPDYDDDSSGDSALDSFFGGAADDDSSYDSRFSGSNLGFTDGNSGHSGVGTLGFGSWATGGDESSVSTSRSNLGSYLDSDDDEDESVAASLYPTAVSTDATEAFGDLTGISGMDSNSYSPDSTGSAEDLGTAPGMTPGTTSGTTTSASGYNGMPMSPMMGGMGGMGAGQQEKERERTTWLAEDEDVWGTDPECAPAVLGRFDDGPSTTESTRPTQQPSRRPQPGQTPTRHQVRGRG